MYAMSSITLLVGQTVSVTANPVDAETPPRSGLLSTGDIPSWQVDLASVATAVAAPNGLSATVTAQGTGTATFSVNGQSAAGPFTSQFQVVVVGGNAVAFQFVFGTPV